jgi:alpha-beta hydrolase superfamily lysophospholipase
MLWSRRSVAALARARRPTAQSLRLILVSISGILLIALGLAASQLPAVGAGGLLHPARHRVVGAPPTTCQDATFAGEGLDLKGWRCHASGRRRATLVYLHGIADNRASAAGVIDRFGRRGFDVVAYDSRAHGESAGDACTYGFLEKRDLQRVLHTVRPGPIVLVGTSLGAAVAIRIPVLLIHGAADSHTPPDHSRRILAALAGPKRLILVPGAQHNESLRGEVWGEIERWIEGVLGQPPG